MHLLLLTVAYRLTVISVSPTKTMAKRSAVKVNDRGPFHGNRVLDLSYGAAKRSLVLPRVLLKRH